METVRFDDPRGFLAAIRSSVAAHPNHWTIVNTVLCSQLAAPFSDQRPVLVAVVDGGNVRAAALQTPPHLLTLVIDPAATRGPDLIDLLIDAIRAERSVVTAISGPRVDVERFWPVWARATGTLAEPGHRLLLHRLTEFRPPTGIDGSPREARPDNDSELIARWWFDFAIEAGTQPQPSAIDPEVLARRVIREHATVLWRVGGVPVAVAGAGAVVDGTVRIGPVYTPPEHRGQHYGSAVTAAAVAQASARGAKAVELFTNADYPTSNNIYRRLGFQPVDEFLEFSIRPAD